MRVPPLLLLAISACTGREHHHSLGALKPHPMSATMKEPTYLELKTQNSKLKRENDLLKGQGGGMERSGVPGAQSPQDEDDSLEVKQCKETLTNLGFNILKKSEEESGADTPEDDDESLSAAAVAAPAPTAAEEEEKECKAKLGELKKFTAKLIKSEPALKTTIESVAKFKLAEFKFKLASFGCFPKFDMTSCKEKTEFPLEPPDLCKLKLAEFKEFVDERKNAKFTEKLKTMVIDNLLSKILDGEAAPAAPRSN